MTAQLVHFVELSGAGREQPFALENSARRPDRALGIFLEADSDIWWNRISTSTFTDSLEPNQLFYIALVHMPFPGPLSANLIL